jgi:hypothetical protein
VPVSGFTLLLHTIHFITKKRRIEILAGSSLLTLLDDIATLLDDISVMGKLAAKRPPVYWEMIYR